MAGLLLAALLIGGVLVLPHHPGALTWGALRVFPLELPVILLALAVLTGRGVRALVVGALLALTLLKLADLAMFTAFARPFNPVVDMPLLRAGWNMAAGTFGPVQAVAGLLLAGAAVAGLACALWWATGRWTGRLRGPWRTAAGGAALLAAAVAGAEVGWATGAWMLPWTPAGSAFTTRLAVERAGLMRQTRVLLAEFRAAAADDPATELAAPLAALAGRDVLVIFVESYGRASFDNPLYAPAHRAILTEAASRLAAAGLAVRSGWLTSPVEGGQSWLAHATLSSGLPVPDLTRHAALLASPRRTLFEMAQAAGWRTVAVAPAVVFPWPEAQRLGFAQVLDRDAMRYQGRPFDWVTMPDQFTLARFRDRLPPDPHPLFAQIALISSHAPWVPVPDPLPWEAVGDGTAFDAMAAGGEPPAVVWADPDRIRAAYGRALAYSLTVTLDWVARQGGDRAPLVLVLGDHPAAGFVSQVEGRDVPAHLIGPPEVIARVEAWGWTPGLIPTADVPRWPMEALRDRFLTAFSGP